MSEGAAPATPRPEATRGATALAFALGFLLFFPLAGIAATPTGRRFASESWQRLVWGSVANGGVRLVLERAPAGGLELVFRNEGKLPRSFFCPAGDEAGVEVDALVRDASGELVPPRPPLDPGTPAPSAQLRFLSLPPGTQAKLRLDLARFVALRPGRYRVVVERARLRPEEPRLRSNELEIDWP